MNTDPTDPRLPAEPILQVGFPRTAVPLLAFPRLLRRFGFPVAPEQTIGFMRAVMLLGPRSMNDIHEAALAMLAPSPDRHDAFEALFHSFFYGDEPALAKEDEQEETEIKDHAGAPSAEFEALQHTEGGEVSSTLEQLSRREFARDDASLMLFRRALPAALPTRRSFRTVRTLSRGDLDLRRSMREIVTADGDMPWPVWRRRKLVPRRLVMLVDISGSMKLHTADYLKLAHAIIQVSDKAEVFTLGTRLTRITPALRIRACDQALSCVADQVDDWDGGTRIGATLQAFLAVPRFSAFARGAAIIVLSDGLERGDHGEMETAMRRLAARAFRLSLATPLAGDPRFQPQTAALKAILPVLDDLVDGSSITSLTRFILALGCPAPGAKTIRRSVA